MFRKRTEITVESDRLVVVRERKRVSAWCTSCARQQEMLATDDAAIPAQVTSRTIFRWAESGKIHYAETPEGLLLICPASLPQNN